MIRVDIDPEAGATYIRLVEDEAAVVLTVPATPTCNVDLDEDGRAIGVELLDWPPTAATRPTLRRESGKRLAATAVENAMATMGVSQAEAARQMNMDNGTLGDFLLGKRWPRSETRATIEQFLGWPVGQIAKLAYAQPA